MGINSGRRFGTSGTVKFTHGKIWTAIDAPARRYGLTPSGLAKRAGLDVTAFDPSKRVTADHVGEPIVVRGSP